MSSVSSVSEVEISDYSGDSSREQSSEASEDSFVSANEDFLPYDENVEPIATEQEVAEYREQVAQEEEEEEVLWRRRCTKLVCDAIYCICVDCRQKTYL